MRIIGNDPKSQNGEVRAVASGALTDGSTVVVNSDGTVEVVEETSVSQAIGTAVVFENAAVNYVSATYDSNSEKVVIAYADTGNSGYGTAVVGTISGTSISFGTPVVFESNQSIRISAVYDSNAQRVVIAYRTFATNFGDAIVGTVSGTSISFGTKVVFLSDTADWISATYDSDSQKVVIAYQDGGNSDYGEAIVGTVSGTSISFGSATVFESATSTKEMSATYDTNAQKVVIAYEDSANSSYGTAVVGTVSGTSISFGTPVVFESATSTDISATYDSNAQKVVIAYTDFGNSEYGTAIVGTVSGTSISFGSPVVFESAASADISATYDSNAQKVVISYEDGGNSDFGTVIVGTVSGTSISFGSPTVFESAQSFAIASTYDSSNQKVAIAYGDGGNSDKGTSIVFQNANTSINLTSENFIGFSDGAYADGDSATIQAGCSVTDAQSGLTAGQAYYVQTDGTLSETPDDPSVLAGTALSATKLLIKG